MSASDADKPNKAAKPSIFLALSGYNYRLWAGGALVSNVGTWMQRTAQDWLVLTGLTHHNASALGVTVGLQFGPQFLLLPFTGYAADRFDRRLLLFVTQGAMGVLALILGVLTITGVVRLWEVYVFAAALGCASAFDAPARQTFVSELAGEEALANAVAWNSASFNAARMVGPAAAGLAIAAIGSGWVFVLNAASFGAVIIALACLRVADLHRGDRAGASEFGMLRQLAEGFAYVWRRPDLIIVLTMIFLVCTFGLNFAIFTSTMTVSVFHGGASTYGMLASVMAVGSLSGALLATTRSRPGLILLTLACAIFGLGCTAAALAPGILTYSLALIVCGVSVQTFTTSTNSFAQLSTEPAMRGRVMAILMAIALGGTPVGAPLVGFIANHYGPRWALALGAASGFGAALVALIHHARSAPDTEQSA